MSTLIREVYGMLKRELDHTNRRVSDSIRISERSETAGGMDQVDLLADAPLAATGGVGAGDLLWIGNGRKTGEGAGAGTGVPAYYDPFTDSWLRLSDDSAVQI